jgi:NAD(P)-dependent dehydrogenase (short-subunit alcohol dehydrogenase family)
MEESMRTFFITGVSSGLGRAFATAALDAGDHVVGTVRKTDDVGAFEAAAPGRAHARVLANVGYGLEGVFEETPLSAMREQFAANVFGVAATLQATLPYLRGRRSGHLMAVTSMGGLMAVPGMSAYCASKFAVEGMLESVRKEVAGFGIHVTAIEPGSFRTDWAGRSMTRAQRSIPDYDALMDPIRTARLAASGNQLGNPQKAAAAVLSILDADEPPAHLVLGSDALALVGAARRAVDEDIRTWETLSRSTDFADGARLAG